MTRYLVPALALCLQSAPLWADQVINDDLIITRDICVGSSTCVDGESFSGEDIKIRSTNPEILFYDTSTNARNRWRVKGDSDVGLFNSFAIRNDITGFTPFIMSEDAPSSAFVVDADGDIGLGTTLPQVPLHVTSETDAGIGIERTNATGGPQLWEIATFSNGDFVLLDRTNNTGPFAARRGTPNNAIFLESNVARINSGFRDYDFEVRGQSGNLIYGDASRGSVGMGTQLPDAPLHVVRTAATTDALQGILVENASATNGPRGLLQLRNNGQVYFGLEDTSIPAGPNSGRAWNFQNNGGEFRVTTAPGGGNDIEMRLLTTGDMIIEGEYYANSTLPAPDYVFAPDYDLKPLAEVQAFIETHSHLPGVPSAAEIADSGLNMTRMQMTLLKKVEELTLYTLEQARTAQAQAERIAAQEAELAALRGLRTRLEQLEQQLAGR